MQSVLGIFNCKWNLRSLETSALVQLTSCADQPNRESDYIYYYKTSERASIASFDLNSCRHEFLSVTSYHRALCIPVATCGRNCVFRPFCNGRTGIPCAALRETILFVLPFPVASMLQPLNTDSDVG